MIRAFCPHCGILGWLAEPTPGVHARIRAEGGNGRVHECSGRAIAGISAQLSAIPLRRTHELGVALDDLVELGRTLPICDQARVRR